MFAEMNDDAYYKFIDECITAVLDNAPSYEKAQDVIQRRAQFRV